MAAAPNRRPKSPAYPGSFPPRPGKIHPISPRFCIPAGKIPLHPLTRLFLLHATASRAPAPAPPPSACHRKPRPCTRAHLPASCLPPQTTYLQPRTPTRLQHVIANQCAHWCGNPRPRRETWQVGTTFGKSVALFRIRPKYCFLSCPAAGDADCHVASLLAMTCRNM